MIRTLRVRNFGVIEEIEVELGAGLTVMTGETGAGKSMLLDALLLLAGGRSRHRHVASGLRRGLGRGRLRALTRARHPPRRDVGLEAVRR
jgi:DNA repair protein RecN (Recombination protein N)